MHRPSINRINWGGMIANRSLFCPILLACAVVWLPSTAQAEPNVTTEYGEIRDGTWRFPTVAGPSRSDLAQQATISLIGGQLHAHGASAPALTDGVVGSAGADPAQAVFFANTCAEGGKVLMDLGSVQPIRQINSFSFHAWNVDQDGRTPQVYSLSGSNDAKTWIKIADVDSRPNATGENWGNRPHGVQIADKAGGDLGQFRYLLWDVKPTRSPLTNKRQSAGEMWSHTFYMELDVHSARAYENSLLYYEHTWGGAMYWITPYHQQRGGIGQCANWNYGEKWKADLAAGRFKRLIESWEEHSDYARAAQRLIAPVLQEEMQALAGSVNVGGRRTVVFNPLPWPRDGVPAMGYRTCAAGQRPTADAPPSADAQAGTLENVRFKITLDPAKGSIRSLVDKRTGRDLVDAGAAHGFGQFLYERFSANEVAGYNRAYVRGGHSWAFAEIGKPNMPSAEQFPYQAMSAGNCQVEACRDGDSTALQMRSSPRPDGLAFPVTTRIILHASAPYVDLEVTLNKPADPWPEAGWICLPLKLATPVNLRGEKTEEPIPIQSARLTCDLPAFAPLSFLLDE